MASGDQPFVEKALEGDDSVDEEDVDGSWDDVAAASQATVPAPAPLSSPPSQTAPPSQLTAPPSQLTAPPEARPTVMMPAVDLAALARLTSNDHDPERR